MPSAFGKPVTTANRFGVVATPSAMTLVTTLTASASASLSYTSFSSASYKTYMLVFNGWRAATASGLEAYYSINAGATYPTSSVDYLTIYPNSTPAFATVGGLGVTAHGLMQNLGDVAKTSGGGVLYFTYGVVASARSQLSGLLGGYTSPFVGSVPNMTSGTFDSTSEVNAIKFQMSSGNITNGTIKIYGIT